MGQIKNHYLIKNPENTNSGLYNIFKTLKTLKMLEYQS
jgi:hypothetical protein